MKTTELFEGLKDVKLQLGNQTKIDRLKELITPEVYAKAYDLMIGLVAKGITTEALDILDAQLNDREADADEILFQAKLIAKALPPEAKAKVIEAEGDAWVEAFLPQLIKYQANQATLKPKRVDQLLAISYGNGKWNVAANEGARLVRKKFDSPNDALTWVLKEFPLRKKQSEKTLAFIKAENAKAKT